MRLADRGPVISVLTMGFSGCPSTNEVVDAKRFTRIRLMPKTKVKTNMVAGKLQIDSARLILVSKQTKFNNANNFIPLMKNVKDKVVQWIDKRYSAEKSEFSVINRLMCVLATHLLKSMPVHIFCCTAALAQYGCKSST